MYNRSIAQSWPEGHSGDGVPFSLLEQEYGTRNDELEQKFRPRRILLRRFFCSRRSKVYRRSICSRKTKGPACTFDGVGDFETRELDSYHSRYHLVMKYLEEVLTCRSGLSRTLRSDDCSSFQGKRKRANKRCSALARVAGSKSCLC